MTRHANPAGASPAPCPHSNALIPYGWTPDLAASFRDRAHPGSEPGRVVAAARGLALVQTAYGELWCAPSGRLRERLQAQEEALCAGDWVVVQPTPEGSKGLLLDRLPRGSALLRQGTGPGGRPQCLASHVEVVLLLMGLDRDFNPARLERLLALAWGSGAQPVVVLTKADLSDRVEAFIARTQGLAPGVPVLSISALTGGGLAAIRDRLPEGRTGVMVGSSGVGKSTLLNALMGCEMRRTQAVRASDGRGRHTTSLRELFRLPGAGCLIDTPGIREVGLAVEGADLEGAFQDVAAFAADCRFRDCAHGAEPGCAVQAALAEGRLDPDRFGHYLRLRREVAFEAARSDERLWRAREERWRRISKAQKRLGKG